MTDSKEMGNEAEFEIPVDADDVEPCMNGKIIEKMEEHEGSREKSDVSSMQIYNENHKMMDGMEEGVKVDRKDAAKGENDSGEEECVPPALPPRPPPRSRQTLACNCRCDIAIGENVFQQSFRRASSRSCWANGLRKYVFLCTACGSLSILLGTLFLTVYFMLKSYTSSLNHFETIPTYVPSGMLMTTGFLIICLACRKNRNSFLMKLCGVCSLCCAVLCVSVTVTTTVIHMNRLQTLRECLYTQKTQSCTCYSVLLDNDRSSDEGIKFVFNSTPDCEVIHGALYSCLRAIFGLSVIGILVCIFSSMLVYQLLSHEKKKMYWTQLEMRCRYLYRQQRNPHYCSCCDECRYPPPPHEIFPWELMGNRFWSSGRTGNLYTPNPEDRNGNSRLRSGWNWRRLPWNRSGSNANEPSRANLSSPDSQYGFNSTTIADGAPYTVLDPRTVNCPSNVPSGTDFTEGGFYSWGPPPPYASNRNSANSSPARRSLGEILHQMSPIRRNDNVSPLRPYHHLHHHMHHSHPISHQCTSSNRQVPSSIPAQTNCLQKPIPSRGMQTANMMLQHQNDIESNLRSNSLTSVHRLQKLDQNKDNYENIYETDGYTSNNGFNTLPSLKKRNQGKVNDLFEKETTSGYCFSSAENLACSESNTGNGNELRNENLPPRVFLLNDTPRGNVPRFNVVDVSEFHNHQVQLDDPEHQSDHQTLRIGNENGRTSLQASSPNRKHVENEDSFVKKLFVSCSPTKQKFKCNSDAQEKRENFVQLNKKLSKKLAPSKDGDTTNENVITFHYRLGIPRSPNVQNFNQFSEKSMMRIENSKDESGSELYNNEHINEDEEQQDNQKVVKGLKCAPKEADLMQKHGTLVKEFAKGSDLQRNSKSKLEKSLGRVPQGGVDNKAFQKMEECPRYQFPKNLSSESKMNYHPSPQDSLGSKAIKMDFKQNEDYLNGSMKNEKESDVYFGDMTNSTCYISTHKEEGAATHRGSFPIGGQSLLNKQNLKMMEFEAGSSIDASLEYERSDIQEGLTYGKLQSDENNSRHSYRNRCAKANQFKFGVEQSSEAKKDEIRLGPSELKPQDTFSKSHRRPFLVAPGYNELDVKSKYFNSIGCYQDHYPPSEHYQETNNSNDENSSSSLTVDSGISTGRNYLPRCFDSSCKEVDCAEGAQNSVENTSDTLFETLNERFSNIEKVQSCKMSNTDNLGDFLHPLFQKPKSVSRENRYRDLDVRPKKSMNLEYDKEPDIEVLSECKRPRNSIANQSKMKANEMAEGMSGQFVNLKSDLELVQRLEHSKNEEEYQRHKAEETPGKSPKPLPRTNVGVVSDNGPSNKQGKYSQSKEKCYLAPDAQYEYKDNFKSGFKQKLHTKKMNSERGKPTVPARPINLQERCRNAKMDHLILLKGYSKTENGCAPPRKRQQQQQGMDESGDNGNNEAGNHSMGEERQGEGLVATSKNRTLSASMRGMLEVEVEAQASRPKREGLLEIVRTRPVLTSGDTIIYHSK